MNTRPELIKRNKPFFEKESKKTVDNCEKCGLYKDCQSPKMKPHGDGKNKTLILAEGPGKEEDLQGIQFVGLAGQYLREKLSGRKLDLDYYFWKDNSVRCRPHIGNSNRKPTRKEINLCHPHIEQSILELKPEYIWIMGTVAVEGMYNHRFKKLGGITKWRRRCIPDRKYNCWVIPMYHPSYVKRQLHLRSGNVEERDDYTDNLDEISGKGYIDPEKIEMVFESDLDFAISCWGRKMPEPFDPADDIKILYDPIKIIEFLEWVLDKKPYIYIDYETTGLQPYREGHKIACMSITIRMKGKFYTYSFPLEYPGCLMRNHKLVIYELIKRILKDPDILMGAHNLKFEDNWTRGFFGVVPEGWEWDTMTEDHIVDARTGTHGLKMQVYFRYGIEGYDKPIEKYLEAEEEGGFNKIMEVPLESLLLYNGFDTNLGMRMLIDQKKQILPSQDEAVDLFHEGILSFCDMEGGGIHINRKFYEDQYKRLTKKFLVLEKEIKESREYKLYKKKTGEELNTNSPDQLKKLFFEFLEYESVKKTAKNRDSTDKEVLHAINTEFTNNILETRKILKNRDTYVGQFLRWETGGKIHPSFDLHTTGSFRSSSSRPGFQNIPVHEEIARKISRGGIVPRYGYLWGEDDFSGLEIRIAECYTQDPVLKIEIENNYDMHLDQASKLFILEPKSVNKGIRFQAKNKFVFAEIYLSYFGACAKRLWEVIIDGLMVNKELSMKSHLRNKGIRTLEEFTEHVKTVEEALWDKYLGIKEWQDRMVKFYMKHGYIELFMGFRREGYLTKNQIVNTPIQGTAFHCLLWCLNRLNRIFKLEKLQSRIVAQIHDSILKEINTKELKYVQNVVQKIMTREIRERFDWINIPMGIESAVSKVDGSWADMEELGV